MKTMLALAEIGHFSLIISLATALILAVLPMAGVVLANHALMRTARMAAFVLFGQISLAFILLTTAFVRSDFSVKLVTAHSHSLKPLLYKISGVWGNHEGSLLLWMLVLGAFSALVAMARLPIDRQARVLSIQGMIASAFLMLILFTSNPFLRLADIPLDGNGLNPILQDPGLAFHPPMLYLGYVGLSVAFSFAVAALLEGKVDKAWARQARPFILIAWSALTMGIALGSWWAYYELGWGGWWFWDPVENASLMPWLIATALIHSIIVVEKQDAFKTWTVLLAILGFSLSLLGTFIVRSGLLTSVHSFASDAARGNVILAMLVVSVGAPLILFALRGGRLASHSNAAPISRETALIANNLLLVVATATVLTGTLYPLGLEAWNGARISVGPPFYNATFAPIAGGMILIMAAAPLIAWKRSELGRLIRRLAPMLIATLIILGAVVVWSGSFNIAALATIGLAVWLTGGVFADIAITTGFGVKGFGAKGPSAKIFGAKRFGVKNLDAAIADRMRRIATIGAGRWGMNIAHLGMAIFIFGAAGASFFEAEKIERILPGEKLTAGNLTYRLDKVESLAGSNYQSTAAFISLLNAEGDVIDTMISERRFYPVAGSFTTEAAIRPRIQGDAYAVLGEGDDSGYILRVYDKPLISWIWAGAGLMALGGLLAINRGRARPNTRSDREKTT